METILGYISETERQEIEDVIEKKQALQNLFLILDQKSETWLWEEAEAAYRQAEQIQIIWWKSVEEKYGWHDRVLWVNIGEGYIYEKSET